MIFIPPSAEGQSKKISQLLYNALEQGWKEDPAFKEQGLHCYHGTKIKIDDSTWFTICFVSEPPRDNSFTKSETLFIEQMTRMLKSEFRYDRAARNQWK